MIKEALNFEYHLRCIEQIHNGLEKLKEDGVIDDFSYFETIDRNGCSVFKYELKKNGMYRPAEYAFDKFGRFVESESFISKGNSFEF